MFDDLPFYLSFRRKVVPFLKTYPSVRVWNVGCSNPDEIYSLAILIHESGLDSKCRIYATESNEKVLHQSQRGAFPKASLARFQMCYRKAGGEKNIRNYFSTKGKQAVIADVIRDNISFFHHSLATDGSLNEFQTILYRGEGKASPSGLDGHVHKLLFESLCVFGVLGLGDGGSIRGSGLEERYEAIDEKAHLYRKVS